ncbi:peptide chain release factor N(5)-glutamine methyltransferase, partial [bacterium]|nr:peptide chain release factor N(5)-glutamine methyltransferase [bacterium]
EFMSVPLKVSPDVLIPRPETELLVDKVIEEAKGLGDIRILDIGTGSGNVAIALACNLPVAIMTGVDLSGKILNVAMENAEKNGVKERIQFFQADVTEDDFYQQVQGSFDIVVSNPPYVSLEEWPGLPEEIREFEPRNALCDEKDGLDFFRIIAGRSGKILTSGGRLFFEIGDGQSESVRKILQKTGYIDIQIFQDLNRIDRIVRGVLGSES